eukprot:CAMPEP_0113478012 /NCGR_PEP_ID=MMETSP0014_2-20120614/20514_1 /TAXON_ID=2857 /ORGANISM="Nitzschia sp." /LENGTH=209 /DNA_ID=CAMNT_0000371145 /DNA_START=118 /DNA_END=743 /DNA_ORIENTATION=+ /assembly_acc=CAM_ASM_000159
MSSTTGPAATTTNSNGDAAASESASASASEASPPLALLMASAASGDDAEGVELSMAFSGTETKQESGKQLQEQQPKVGNGEIGHDDNGNDDNNGDGEDDDHDAGTTATADECCVDDDDGCDDDDTKNVPSILPPLTPEVYEEYRRDQELAEEARQKAKLMSMRTVHICGVPWCMCLPLLLLIIAVIIGTIFAIVNYNASDSLQPPSFAP